MFVKIVVLVILFAAVFVTDFPKWKSFGRRERMTYSIIIAVAVYLGVDYAADMSWLNLNDLINVVFGEPAKRIVEAIKLPS